MTTLNDCFDHIYCITLDRRPERWRKAKQQFKELNIEVERFSAIDGNKLSEGKIKKYPILNKYAIGCMLSHYKIIEDAKKHKYKNILIFEDDVIFHKNFVEEFSKQIKKIKNWKLLHLGATQTHWDNIKFEDGFYYSLTSLGTFAIGINESIYEEIVALTDINAAIDTKYVNIQHKHYKECYTFYPNLVIADVSESDIRGHRDETDFRKMVKWDGSLYDTKTKQIEENSQIQTKQEHPKCTHCGKEILPTNKRKKPVSIIIPAYKSQDFIEECLNSIQNQTYFQDFDDYEILVGVDGCDKTLKKLYDIQNRYKNLNIYIMNSNMGAYVTINTLIMISKYENIIRFDSDDIMLPELIEESCKYFDKYDIVRWWYQNYKDNTITSKSNRGANGALFLKKSFFNKMGGYKNWKCAADLEFLQRASTISKQFVIEKSLMLYRIHDNSLTNAKETSMMSELRKEYHKKISNKFEYISPKTNTFKKLHCATKKTPYIEKIDKIVVYTCIVGEYDKLQEVKFPEKNIKYICFTNQKIKSNTWDIQNIPIFLKDLSESKQARCIKIMAHLFLSDYDISLWIDGNIQVVGKVSDFIYNHIGRDKDCYFYIPKHPYRICVYEEAKTCIKLKKDDEKIINEQIRKYKKLKYPENYGMVQSGVLLRIHNKCVNIQEQWWNEVLEHSKRDQLSFNYVLWRNKDFKVKALSPKIISSEYFSFWGHSKKGNKIIELPSNYGSITNYINGKKV